MEATAFHAARNVTAILDMNRLGQRGPTMHGWHADVFRDRALAFGWNAVEIDGHDVDEIDRAYTGAAADERPTMIVAHTQKGHGVSFLQDKEGWHGKAVPADKLDAAVGELGGDRHIRFTPPAPIDIAEPKAYTSSAVERPVYDAPIATRKAFGEALAWLTGTDHDVVVLDGEVGNSTYTEDAEKIAPDRFVQMYIAEQCMIGVQTGLQALGKKAFAATFGAFLTRAADQIRMGTVSRADLRLCGSHAGISIGEDGPSQMAIEDLALFRALAGSTVLYPADGTSAVALTERMASLEGISYLRSTREATPVLYGADDDFPVGGSKTLASSDNDDVTLVGAGITLHECLAARDQLATERITARVIDCYSVKPIDAATLRTAIDQTGVVIVVEDHRIEGGLGDAVLDALAATGPLTGRVRKLAVTGVPGSATPTELRAWAGIDAASIAEAARTEVGR
jgi:transketolase